MGWGVEISEGERAVKESWDMEFGVRRMSNGEGVSISDL